MTERKKKHYSYIRYPFSKTGWYCIAIGLIAVLLTAVTLVTAVSSSSEVSLFTASVGLSAILTDLCGMVFLFNALKEKEKNHIFTLIGGAMLAGVLMMWVYVFMF